jgi:hypothetical protein
VFHVFCRFTPPSSAGEFIKGKLSVNHLVVLLPDNRRQVHMPTKMNILKDNFELT